MITLLLLFCLALAAGLLSGVVGTGSSMILLPTLVWQFGSQVAVPVMGIAAMMGNLGRAIAWWRQVHWAPVLVYALPGIPAAMLGARTLLAVPAELASVALGTLFAAVIPIRRIAARAQWRLNLRQMALAGAVIGFLTGMLLSTGPLSVPAFTGFGLSSGAFLGSEAASALLLYAGKLATFGSAGALDTQVLYWGVVIGVALLLGALLARRIVQAMPVRRFEVLIDLVLGIAALSMLTAAGR